MIAAGPRVVVVTPVCDDLDAVGQFLRQLALALGRDPLVVVVDDGSIRPLEPSIIEVAGLRGVVIRLKRNVGHQSAIAIGLGYVAEHMPDATCIIADADGEDVPSKISELLDALASADVDVVVAERRRRVESLSFRVLYMVYKSSFHALSGRRINFGNFMALEPAAVQRLVAMHELWIHVAATLLVSRLRIAIRPIDRGPRYAGRSQMSFAGLVLHGFRALTVVAQDILLRVGMACTLLAAVALVGIVTLLALKFPGWVAAALGIAALMVLQTAILTFIALLLINVGRRGPVNYRDFIDKLLIAELSKGGG
jgi:glycosyltransferase involved in cell wall biosynthesis